MSCVLAGALSGAHAEKADRDKPMNIEADKLVHDDPQQRSVFTGKVVATKGTLIFRGDRLEVWEDGQAHQFGLLTPAPGQRAFFRQKREGLNEFMEGEAERVEYDGQAVVCRAEAAALAAEGKHQQAQGWMAGAIRYRSRVIALDVELSGLRARRGGSRRGHESSRAAAMPRRRSDCTWSFISAMSGEITSVTPSSSSAGS